MARVNLEVYRSQHCAPGCVNSKSTNTCDLKIQIELLFLLVVSS